MHRESYANFYEGGLNPGVTGRSRITNTQIVTEGMEVSQWMG
jgi:hypothetical protein